MRAEKYAQTLIVQNKKLRDLNVFVSLDEDIFLEAARKADIHRAAGKALGSLHGLPFVVKDNIEYALLPTTACTPSLENHQPNRNAVVVQSLLDAGALVMGKTNMHEIAYGLTSNNAHTGPVRNPYDRTLIAGGSSGGTAAAIAAWIAPAGLGSDTGGSIRHPASMCGITGLRPTTERYSLNGVIPISRTRDTVGPMARSVDDLVLLDRVMTNAAEPVEAMPLNGLRLAVPRNHFYDQLDAEILPIINSALEQLTENGVILIEADIPGAEKCNWEIARIISIYESLPALEQYLRKSGAEVNLATLIAEIASPDVRNVIESRLADNSVCEDDYRRAMDKRRAFQETYRQYFLDHDVAAAIFPTTRLPARPVGDDDTIRFMGKRVSTTNAYNHNLAPATVVGSPGLSVPVGQTKSHLPVAMELDGPSGCDRALMAIGLSWEKVFPPPIPPVD